jgi:hypothetical protein
MAEQLSKLRPDRDLQCYFQEPSAIAALSATSPSGFTVSGSWRQQFDWAVVEWNRDNVFEYPALRNLPDGDLSGVQLSYIETRTNCMAMDSTMYDSIGWSWLRIWEESGGVENFHAVLLKNYASAVGGYTGATVSFELQGTLVPGDYVELAWLEEHWNYLVQAGDTAQSAMAGLAAAINTGSATASASVVNGQIVLTYKSTVGANGNRVGVYGTVHGAGTERWTPQSTMFSGGISPQQWAITLNFGNLTDTAGQHVNVTNVRKLRWTWAADLQPTTFQRGEFSVVVTNWSISGTNLVYNVAAPGSLRLYEPPGMHGQGSTTVVFSGSWVEERGNYWSGSIAHTTHPGDTVQIIYSSPLSHTLYCGTRFAGNGGQVSVQVDSGTPVTVNLKLAGEDFLARVPIGVQTAGVIHTVSITHAGVDGTDVYFDFLEAAVPTSSLPSFATSATTTLATDWDTNHSIAIPPERTAWLINTLGFKGRANHYAGALWFYELVSEGSAYASATITFSGAPVFGGTTTISVGGSAISHLNLIGDTAASIATCFALLISAGSSAVWARTGGATLTITARQPGTQGNAIGISATTTGAFTATVSGATFSGGANGIWLTDLNALPRLNRAARDWSLSYFTALKSYGIDAAAAFSTELGNGDSSDAAGIAQKYTDGPCLVNTPALQTNFSPTSRTFWQQVYLDMAAIMTTAGLIPYLQFGEVQWWYFATGHTSMPFYDAYTLSQFQAQYGRAMGVITDQNADPTQFPQECAFLPTLIGAHTQAIMSFVRQSYPQARFEVLYPPDTNNTALNKLVNFPSASWTPAILDCLKTENFTYTGNRDLNRARQSIGLPMTLSFPLSKSSHLVGIGGYTTPWDTERRLAMGAGLESVVLFALDQFCLIGYGLPMDRGPRRAQFLGK